MNLPKTELTNEKLDAELFELYKDLASDWYINPVGNANTDFLEEKMAYWLRDNYTEHFRNLIHQAEIKARIDELKNFADDEGSSGAYYLKVNGNNIQDRIEALEEEIVCKE